MVGTGGLVAAAGSVVAGGALAAATVVGVISSQTAAPDKSPADTSQAAPFDYGSSNS